MNATGRVGEINSDIKAFLRYVNSGKVKGEFTSRIDEKLKELKSREEIEVEYMTLELILQDAKDDGMFATELKNLRHLIKKLHLTIEEAMDILEVPETEKPKYVSALEEENN